MNWFDRWLSGKIKHAWNAENQTQIYDSPKNINSLIGSNAKHRSLDVQATMNFRLHHAENGWIVEVNCYDQRTDRHTTKMHLIGDDQEFDRAICQIITLESLRG